MIDNDSAHLVLMQCGVCPRTLNISWKRICFPNEMLEFDSTTNSWLSSWPWTATLCNNNQPTPWNTVLFGKPLIAQEIARCYWNRKIHYYVQKTPPFFSVLIQMNSVYILTRCI